MFRKIGTLSLPAIAGVVLLRLKSINHNDLQTPSKEARIAINVSFAATNKKNLRAQQFPGADLPKNHAAKPQDDIAK